LKALLGFQALTMKVSGKGSGLVGGRVVGRLEGEGGRGEVGGSHITNLPPLCMSAFTTP